MDDATREKIKNEMAEKKFEIIPEEKGEDGEGEDEENEDLVTSKRPSNKQRGS